MTRVAVIGAAHAHVEYALDEIRRHPGLDLIAVSDASPDLAAACAGPFEAATFTDHRELLEKTDPDVVVIAGIYGDRGPAVVDALLAGCHVVADKPLCTTIEELNAISDASRSTGRSVSLLLEKRYYPETRAAKILIDRGDLGEVVAITSTGPHKLNRATRPDWFFHRDAYGGLLNDLCVHDLDLGLWFTAATRASVTAAMSAPLAEHPTFLRYGTTVVATPTAVICAEASWLTPLASAVHGDYQLRITGTRGTAELFWAQHRMVVTTDTDGTHEVSLPPGLRPAEQAFTAFVAGDLPEITTHDSVAATRLALLAQLSADQQGTTFQWSSAA